jgi:hypothetical protein
MNANESQTINLAAGQVLTVTAPPGATGSAVRLSRSPGGGNAQSLTAIAGANLTFGPYADVERFEVICTAGTVALSAAPFDPDAKTGSVTNDDAITGDIGEFKITTVAVGNVVSETTNTPVDVCSLSLTAGGWDVSGVINRSLGGTTATRYAGAISPTVDAIPAQAGGSGVGADSVVTNNATFGTTITGNYITTIGPVRVSLAATTTIHLVAADLFSAGSIGLFGSLKARRVR